MNCKLRKEYSKQNEFFSIRVLQQQKVKRTRERDWKRKREREVVSKVNKL